MRKRVLQQPAGDDELGDRHARPSRTPRRSCGCRTRWPRAAPGRCPRAGWPASARRSARTARGRPAPSGCRCASPARPARARRPAGAAASSVSSSCTRQPAARGLARRTAPGRACVDEPAEDVADAALPGLVAPAGPAMMPPSTTPHMPGTSRELVAVHHVAGRGAHDRDHLAGLDGLGGRRGDVRVDVADRDRDALGQAGPRGGLGGQPAGAARRAGRSGGRACRRRSRRSPG